MHAWQSAVIIINSQISLSLNWNLRAELFIRWFKEKLNSGKIQLTRMFYMSQLFIISLMHPTKSKLKEKIAHHHHLFRGRWHIHKQFIISYSNNETFPLPCGKYGNKHHPKIINGFGHFNEFKNPIFSPTHYKQTFF